MSGTAQRRFLMDLAELLDKNVMVITKDGKTFEGTLSGFDHPSLNISLINVKISNEFYPKVIIKGDTIAEIITKERPLFDVKEFARILERYFPNLVKVHDKAGIIMIGDKIKVSEKGVEGVGPIADRIRKLFNEYIESKESEAK